MIKKVNGILYYLGKGQACVDCAAYRKNELCKELAKDCRPQEVWTKSAVSQANNELIQHCFNKDIDTQALAKACPTLMEILKS